MDAAHRLEVSFQIICHILQLLLSHRDLHIETSGAFHFTWTTEQSARKRQVILSTLLFESVQVFRYNPD